MNVRSEAALALAHSVFRLKQSSPNKPLAMMRRLAMATRRQRTWFAHPCPSLYPRPALSPSLPVSPRRLGRRKTAAAGRQAYGSYFKINVAPRSARCAVRAREGLKEAREVGWLFRSLDDCSFLQRVRGVPLSAPPSYPDPFALGCHRPSPPSFLPCFGSAFRPIFTNK